MGRDETIGWLRSIGASLPPEQYEKFEDFMPEFTRRSYEQAEMANPADEPTVH